MPPSPVPKGEPFKVPQAFAQAVALHTQGRLNEAERMIKAIGSRHPFLLAYQGENDRALQKDYGDMISRIVAQSFSPAPLPPPPAPGEVIRVGIVSSFFYRHSNWKIPIKGWVSQLDRNRFHVTGYHLGAIRDE
ncbi:MAG TPA: hypothetical protein VKP52_08795 [Pseudolabrys sp.]|jgi:hypothetical protein|nr:hypothetical protein [Pseudolabrys sp.]